ncbi:MAG: hypothetical protein NTY22_08410, partial [Proteobacteria bacterium]|nr:hypothetical protein [Pseudomonadota bacterium]
NQNPTANVPYPYPTTLGYCRALKSDGSLGLCINENCNSQGGQCTGTTTTCAGIGQKCTNSSGSIICTCDSGVNKCRLNYGELCSSTDQCKTPGVCHTICLQANLGLGASCTTTDQCQANMTCKDGICKGNNGFLGCGNDNTKCVSGICENLVKPTVPGYYCVGHQAEACTGNFPPQTSGGLYTQPYYEGAGTQCIHGVCEDGYCGIRPSGPCLYYNSPIGDYCRHYTGTPGLGNNCWQLQGSWYCN